MTKLYFGVSQGKSITSKIIKWVQWGDKHTHAFYIKDDIFSKDPLVIEAWHEPILKGGLVSQGRFFRKDLHKPGTKYSIYSIEVTEKQKIDFELFLQSKLGSKYDFRGILGFALKSKSTQSDMAYFCSELLFEALQHIGINLLQNTTAEQVDPALFIKSPLLILEKRA